MVIPLSPRDARAKFPHAYQDLNNGAFERSPLSSLDRELKPFYYEMPSPVLALLFELIDFKRRIEAATEEEGRVLASDALSRSFYVLSRVESLDYQLFIIVLRHFFLLFGPKDQMLGHLSNGKELFRNKKELIPQAIIPRPLLRDTIKALIYIHQKQLYKSENQIEHFLFLIPSYKFYGFELFFDVFCSLFHKDMSIYEFETELKYALYCLNLIQKDGVEYNLLRYSEAIFLNEIKESGIRRSVSFRYFLHTLSHNEMDLSLLNVWMHVFSQVPIDDLTYIRNESMLFLYNRFSAIEPVIEPRRWYSKNEALHRARKILSASGPIEPPDCTFERGVLKIKSSSIDPEWLSALKRIPGVREVVAVDKVKAHEPIRETINLLKTAKFLLDGSVFDLKAIRGFLYYYHSFFPHGELSAKEAKIAAKMYRRFFKNAPFEDNDRLYLELVYRNPFSKSLKKWKKECDWEKEACKLINDYMARQYPLHMIEKCIAALYRFFLTKKDYKQRAPLLLRDLYFEVQKKSTHALDKINWLIKGLEHEPIDEEPISPFLCTLPEVLLSNGRIPLKTHLRLITLMRTCYKLPSKIIDSWLKKFLKVHSNYKTVSFSELKVLIELFKANEYTLDEWKQIAVILISIPIEDKVLMTGTFESASALIDEIKSSLFESFSSTYKRHQALSKIDSFHVDAFLFDLSDQFFIHSISCFVKEIKSLEQKIVQSIIRFNDTIERRNAEEMMRKAVLAFPDKLKVAETQFSLCKLIDRCLERLHNKEEAEQMLKKNLKFSGNYSHSYFQSSLSFGSRLRELSNRSIFISIWLRQFVQLEAINFQDWKRFSEHLEKHTYNCKEWEILVMILDVPIEENIAKWNELESISRISEPIDTFMARFRSDCLLERGEEAIHDDVIRIKDKYYLNVLLNLVREGTFLPESNHKAIERIEKALKFSYLNLKDEKARAEEFLKENYRRDILLPK